MDPKEYAGSETFSVRAEVKLEKQTRDGDECADARDYLLQTQSFRNGLVRFVSDTPALRHKPQLKHHHR